MNTTKITPLTAQQVVDNALNGLRKQGGASMNNLTDKCAYRGHDNRKCGIGFSIPDELYERSFDSEGEAISTLLFRHKTLEKLFQDIPCQFLDHVQGCHDRNSPVGLLNLEGFEKSMESVCKSWNAKLGVVYTPPPAVVKA